MPPAGAGAAALLAQPPRARRAAPRGSPARACRALRACATPAAAAAAAAAAGWSVHIAKTPLVGLEALGALMGDAYPGAFEHAVVVVAAPDGSVRYRRRGAAGPHARRRVMMEAHA
jgi:hypothetical protein